MANTSPKLLFLVNPLAGKKNANWSRLIREHFLPHPVVIKVIEMPEACDTSEIKLAIKQFGPDKLVAVGGDGTVKLAAESLLQTNIPLCILPAGSANGMAKELNIPVDPADAMNVIINGVVKKIHLVKINEQLCIHLGDIGFNAFVVKKFEEANIRGMWGYIKAAWKVLWTHARMQVEIKVDDGYISRDAAMVVIANASRYGNGVVINPAGSLEDELFEVVIIKKISFTEIFKMRFTHTDYNKRKTELFQTRSLKIKSHHHLHFQVDGEYLGKVNKVDAEIIPHALRIIVPAAVEKNKQHHSQ